MPALPMYHQQYLVPFPTRCYRYNYIISIKSRDSFYSTRTGKKIQEKTHRIDPRLLKYLFRYHIYQDILMIVD